MNRVHAAGEVFIPEKMVCNCAGDTGENWDKGYAVMGSEAVGEMGKILGILRLLYMLFIFV